MRQDGPARLIFGPDSGTPVLLLHGLPTGAAMAEPLARELGRRGLRACALDLPGYGAQPDVLRRDRSVTAHAAWLRAELDGLGWERPVVLGHDYGGLLAAELAVAGRARAVVLSSAVTDRGWWFARFTALPGLERYFYRAHAGRLYLQLGVRADRRDDLQRLFLPQTRSPDMPDRMRDTARGLSLARLGRLPALLRATGVPLLALWGADDPFFRPRAARRIARKHGPDAQVTLVAGARHYVWWDRPVACAAAVERWLQSVPKARSPASPSPGKM
jgi:pimeloyl-ACP methyl ester carboxylesterase